MTAFQSAYIQTHAKGLLKDKIQRARQHLRACTLCPRQCGVNRLEGETGVCNTGESALVASFNAHFGEESPLVGRNGSGTIFFTHCNLMCNFCQNYDISHESAGQQVVDEQLADMMVSLQKAGCHNINFVTPTHVIYPLLVALPIAIEKGLSVPLVYNSGGYDAVESLKILDGVIDIYMPDFKFWDAAIAKQTCDAEDYPDVARKAVLEMHRQVGDLKIDSGGVAQRGLLVRHLVLPQDLAGTRMVMRFIAREVSKDTYVNIMPQYRPCGRAHEVQALSKSLSTADYQKALISAEKEGVTRLDRRGPMFGLF